VAVSEAWELHAHDWIRWTRSSREDGFRDGTWPELQAVLPPPEPDGLVVDLGCGEGRLARELRPLGYRIIGLDRSPTLIVAAQAADMLTPVVLADAARVPLRDGCADLVVACMSLLDLDDLDGALAEVGRILGPSGTLCIAIVHPFSSAQDLSLSVSNDDPVFRHRYLDERVTIDIVDTGDGDGDGDGDEPSMTFVSIHRPLSRYVTALAANGFAITALRELGQHRIPWLLVMRAEKVVSRSPA
jgi:SAM-dependent methyltransferase